MGGLGNVPNFDAWLQTAWGAGAEYWCAGYRNSLFIGLTFGQNPPYTLDDFLANYPDFFGAPTAYTGSSTTIGSADITVLSTAGLGAGQFLQSADFPSGTLIKSVGVGQVTVTNVALSTDNNATLSVYTQPMLPIFVIQLYLNLAYTSIDQESWQDAWLVAMGWFIAHYCTLYMKSSAVEIQSIIQTSMHGEVPVGAIPGTVFTLSSAPPTGTLQGLYAAGAFILPTTYTLAGNVITLTNSTAVALYATWPVQQTVLSKSSPTAAQVAARGLADGVLVSKSVGDVSGSYQTLAALEEWGTWNLTWFGLQLANMAKSIFAGPYMAW